MNLDKNSEQSDPHAPRELGAPESEAFAHRLATTSQNVVLEEKTLFEVSRPGAAGAALPALAVPRIERTAGLYRRTRELRLPELSEPEVVRHFTRLSTWNYAIDLGMYPLGSCTMKYNPRVNEAVARDARVVEAHPHDPASWTQGHLQIMHELRLDLMAITGLNDVCLMPAAGAQGELTGLLLIARYHELKGRPRKKIITTDSAHGTNPASAALAGFTVVQVPTSKDGTVETEAVRAVLDDDVAGLMVTNPNTLGIFEKNIGEIADLLHEKDALLYIDGANLNAVLGLARPGDFGADVIQFNLHKTFSTPHGGGGPGSGPIAVSERLAPLLPLPIVEKSPEGSYRLVTSDSSGRRLGRVKSFYGNFGMFVRAWVYIRALGGEGLRAVSENAILNANYLKARLQDVLHLPVQGYNLHEVVFNDRLQRDSGLDTSTLAKRILDYGFHPPTVYFPLCVKNAIMMEPTETEPLAELDRFVEAVREIVRNPDIGTDVPQFVPRGRVDETRAARRLRLTFFDEG